ncbi:MAG TPA: hypothetical protein PLW75_01270 [Hyphomicrobium sp.]|nr:hypothetical protein [Hyphomicrobium sp.]
MKNSKPDASRPSALTTLDPSHPNYDAILLKRARLEAYRRRRLENQGLLLARDKTPVAAKPTKKRTRRRDA